MSFAFESTGHELVDAIRGLQIVADQADDPELKLKYLRKGILTLGARELFEKQFLISSFQAFVQGLDTPPDTRRLFSDGLYFIGKLELFSYMLDGDIPVDSLTLGFVETEVIGVAEEDIPHMRNWRVQVPVLAIESCVSADAA